MQVTKSLDTYTRPCSFQSYISIWMPGDHLRHNKPIQAHLAMLFDKLDQLFDAG